MKKEKRWRGDLEGWEILKPQREVAWDDRFADTLRIFIDPREDI
jgi:import inner membrane translocase subunit TIM54